MSRSRRGSAAYLCDGWRHHSRLPWDSALVVVSSSAVRNNFIENVYVCLSVWTRSEDRTTLPVLNDENEWISIGANSFWGRGPH